MEASQEREEKKQQPEIEKKKESCQNNREYGISTEASVLAGLTALSYLQEISISKRESLEVEFLLEAIERCDATVLDILCEKYTFDAKTLLRAYKTLPKQQNVAHSKEADQKYCASTLAKMFIDMHQANDDSDYDDKDSEQSNSEEEQELESVP